MTSDYPGETRWKLRPIKGGSWLDKTIYGRYESPQTLYKEDRCYEDDCFKLTVQNRNTKVFLESGYYSLKVNGQLIVDQQSDFLKHQATFGEC